jgi:hypothetical protein
VRTPMLPRSRLSQITNNNQKHGADLVCFLPTDLSEKQKAGVAAALDDISSDREADALRTVKVHYVQ